MNLTMTLTLALLLLPFSGELLAAEDPTLTSITFVDGSATFPPGPCMDPNYADDYISVTDDPVGPWTLDAVHFKGVNLPGGKTLVYRYRLEFNGPVQLSALTVHGAAWNSITLLDESMNTLEHIGPLGWGNEFYRLTLRPTKNAIGTIFYLEENQNYPYWVYRARLRAHYDAPCHADADILLSGSEYAAKSQTPLRWDESNDVIWTWWKDTWVQYEAYLTKGRWNIGLCAMNHAHPGNEGLGDDPKFYPAFKLSNSLTDDIITVPASDKYLQSGYFTYDVPADGTYAVRFTWLNDKTLGNQPEGLGPILDANLRIAGVFFDKLPDSIATVGIDIMPGNFPNSINLGSNGRIPVAILSSGDFDATTVDPESVRLAGASVGVRGKGTPMSSVEDVNRDGLADFVVHVSTEALELTVGDVKAVLTGVTFDGTSFQGSDSIRVVP